MANMKSQLLYCLWMLGEGIMSVLQWFYISASWGREVRRERDSFSLSFDKKFENWIIIDLIDLASFNIKEGNKENEAVMGIQYGPGTVSILHMSQLSNPHDNLGSRYNCPNYMDVQIEVERLNTTSACSVTQPRFAPLIFWHIKPYSFTNLLAWDLLT